MTVKARASRCSSSPELEGLPSCDGRMTAKVQRFVSMLYDAPLA
jgi:hypothetical protein